MNVLSDLWEVFHSAAHAGCAPSAAGQVPNAEGWEKPHFWKAQLVQGLEMFWKGKADELRLEVKQLSDQVRRVSVTATVALPE